MQAQIFVRITVETQPRKLPVHVGRRFADVGTAPMQPPVSIHGLDGAGLVDKLTHAKVFGSQIGIVGGQVGVVGQFQFQAARHPSQRRAELSCGHKITERTREIGVERQHVDLVGQFGKRRIGVILMNVGHDYRRGFEPPVNPQMVHIGQAHKRQIAGEAAATLRAKSQIGVHQRQIDHPPAQIARQRPGLVQVTDVV